MEEGKGLAVKEETLPQEYKEIRSDIPTPTVQSRMEELIPYAGTIEITEMQRAILFAPVNPDSVEIRPDGLVYLPWMEYVRRLRDAFGIGWAIIPKDMPKIQSNHMYWPFYLMIQGKLAGFSIGEQEYQPNNRNMSYSDASEGAKSNALMRLCKGIGISLELWQPSFIRSWKAKYAEEYEDQGRKKWRRKDRIANGEAQEAGDQVNEGKTYDVDPPPASPSELPIFTAPIDSITKKDGEKDGKPYTRYTIKVGDQKLFTFSKSIAEEAKKYATEKKSAVLEYKQTTYGLELVSISPVGSRQE